MSIILIRTTTKTLQTRLFKKLIQSTKFSIIDTKMTATSEMEVMKILTMRQRVKVAATNLTKTTTIPRLMIPSTKITTTPATTTPPQTTTLIMSTTTTTTTTIKERTTKVFLL